MKALTRNLSRVAGEGIALAAVGLLSLGMYANGASAAAASPTVTAADASGSPAAVTSKGQQQGNYTVDFRWRTGSLPQFRVKYPLT